MAKRKGASTGLKEARALVSNLFGERLAQKASDAFLLAFGRPQATSETGGAGLETTAAPWAGGPRSVVLEFSEQPRVSAEVNKAVDALKALPEWRVVREALKRIRLDKVTRGVMTEVMEAGRSEPEVLPVYAAQMLRQVKVSAVRDNFLKVTGPITSMIERAAPGILRTLTAGMPLLAVAESAVAGRAATGATQVCWLNRTVRARVGPAALADVVADASVERVDLPRRLEPEIDVCGVTVGAPAFRVASEFDGRGIIVAVIDSEVALNHPALKGRVVHKRNFTDEPWGNPEAHGTAVAGIIASRDATFSGVAPAATIYNYKVLATNRTLTGDSFDGALAVQQALEDGAHVANCSWGAGPAGDGTSPEARACDTAWGMGMVIVKSAGNKGPGAKTCTSPADADGVIAVGATEREGKTVQDYSSRGPAGTKKRPHLIAPGGILGGTGVTSCLPGGGFGDCGAGTSFAAPHVAGMAALLLDRDADLTPDQCRELLVKAGKALTGVSVAAQGKGMVSMARV